MIQFTVYGEAVAQGRPRGTSRGGHVRMYDPEKSKDYKHYVRLAAGQYAPAQPLEGPLAMVLVVYRKIPKSFSKAKTAAAERGEILPTSKPDVDNYLKGVKDALSGIMWKDDNQVVDAFARKRYSSRPRIEVKIKQL